MADWYASSVAHAAIPQWQANTAYTVGQFVRALAAPAQNYYHFVFRCTVAGTSGPSEPNWSSNLTDGAAVASGTATFMNVTGRGVHGWSAAAGSIHTMSAQVVQRMVGGDRLFVSSDSVETIPTTTILMSNPQWGGVSIISVNRAGSVPPIAADIQAGAVINATISGQWYMEAPIPTFWQGITFNISAGSIFFNSGYTKSQYFKDCVFNLLNAGVTRTFANNPSKVTWDNTTYKVSNAGSTIDVSSYAFDFTWINTPDAVKGPTFPTTLLRAAGGALGTFTLRGIDLSMLTGTILGIPGSTAYCKVLLDECRINPAVARLHTSFGTGAQAGELIELVNCFDGTNVVNERHRCAGSLTTDRSTVVSDGAVDSQGAYSLKLVSSSRSDKAGVESLDTFFLDIENTAIGAAKTANVEIISSGTLNTDDVWLELEYLGTAGSSLSSFKDSKTIVGTALPTSSVTWNNPPVTPVKQYLQVPFTPWQAGRVRGRVLLGKPSTTIWVNPQLTLG